MDKLMASSSSDQFDMDWYLDSRVGDWNLGLFPPFPINNILRRKTTRLLHEQGMLQESEELMLEVGVAVVQMAWDMVISC